MDNILRPGNHNAGLDEALQSGPDEVAEALEAWRTATLNREKTEALLYVRYKGEDKERTASEIKAFINSDSIRYEDVLREIKAESNYERLYERLMSNKKRADLRTAF